jgi:hypothetical protein
MLLKKLSIKLFKERNAKHLHILERNSIKCLFSVVLEMVLKLSCFPSFSQPNYYRK